MKAISMNHPAVTIDISALMINLTNSGVLGLITKVNRLKKTMLPLD